MTTNAGIVTASGTTLLVASMLPNARPPVVDSVQICPTIMACTGAETEMDSVAFVAPAALLTTSTPSPGTLRVAVTLDATIGDFQIGTLGLFVGPTLFALATFPGAGSKLAANPPLASGNVRTLYVDTAYVDVGGTAATPAPIYASTDAIVQAIIYGS